MSPARRGLARNLLSDAGLAIALLALTNTLFLIYIDSRQAHSNPYLGILAWIVGPAILIFGLVLYFAGMIAELRRRRRLAPGQVPEYPRIDFNIRRTRIIVISTFAGLIIFVTASAIGTYQAYHYTESDAFCGGVCHGPMKPEYTAYRISPHARVGCVACHVGGGATSYLRSKLAGVHQLYGVITNKYPRPIPTPVSNLRPAQDTCEQCHWPQRFVGEQLKVFQHYAYDETSTPREVSLLIKTGGGSASGHQAAGIHWHMNLGNEVTYVAADPQRQQIPWVRSKDRSGHITEYLAEGSKMTAAQIAAAPKRRVDCIDCHNRPSHMYLSPDRAVDRALTAGRLDRALPFVKQQAVAVLAKDYRTSAEALRTIASEFRDYYRKSYPQVAASSKTSIDQGVVTLQQIFSTTRFPEMRVDWRTHPDHIGHFYATGCFRCHDDQHVSADGKRISKDCQICHTMQPVSAKPAQFEHPVDLGDLRGVNCADCHNGGGM